MENNISAKIKLIILPIALYTIFSINPQKTFSQDILHDCPPGAILKIDTLLEYTVYSCIIDDSLHGIAKGYYRDGILKFENHWDRGKPVGIWKEWDKKGNLYSTTEYENGLKHGNEIFYFEDGKKKVKTSYQNGIKHGRIDQWNEDGNHLIEGNFENGSEDGLWFIRKNENKIVAIQYNKGQKLFEREQDWKKIKLPKVKYK